MKVHNPGFLQVVADAKARVREIGVEEYRRQAGSLVLLDVREDHEWNEAHPKARSI